jgi:hypothetical protein
LPKNAFEAKVKRGENITQYRLQLKMERCERSAYFEQCSPDETTRK